MRLTRRKFLTGSVGAGGACLAVAAGMNDIFDARGRSLSAWRHEGAALGTTTSIIALHPDREIARQAAEEAFAEVLLVEKLMSIYRPDSQVSRLNEAKALKSPHPYLVQVLKAGCEMSAASYGAFDATVQPLWECHARAHALGRVAANEEIGEATARVDWRRIEISPDEIRLRGEGTRITLNGIAQGFAADRALAALAQRGASGLISAGELASRGTRSDGQPWRVGIQHPRHADAYAAVIPLDNRRLATSGDYATAFSEDFSRCHVFDPQTGLSPTELASVSILAPSAMQADALSTAVFVMGRKRGWSLVQSLADVDAFFVLKDGRTMATPGFPLT
jgi:thiamine biosynthesis lipoprotein